jgi:Fe2+ or Zn2+ uptake regulation protein
MNSTEEGPDIAEIADEIFNYLSEHPDAVDSLEGIAKWLKQQGYSVVLEDIKGALEYLKAPGFIIESHGRNGEALYKSAYASTGEI